jgi:hypothetical protein
VSFHQGYLTGRLWTPVEIAELGYKHGWTGGIELVEFSAVCLSESAGYERAHCFNYRDAEHKHMYAEDVGLMQISVWQDRPLPYTHKLWNADTNIEAARRLYKTRGWQPWHGFTNFIATNPDMAGEYIQRAIWGVGNFYRKLYGVKQLPYPKKGTRLRAILDKLTAGEHPVVPPFQSRSLGLRPQGDENV